MVLPSVFTPNGDGANDEYSAMGAYVKDFRMKIFNMQGELLFNTNDKSYRWNGKYKGRMQPVGSYRVEVYFKTLGNEEVVRVVYVSLVTGDCVPYGYKSCIFGDMIDPMYGIIYTTTEIFCN